MSLTATIASLSGLSGTEAQNRLKKEGYNELPSQKSHSWLDILLSVFKEPMIFLLVFTGLIYLFLGEVPDALMLLGGIFIVIGITFFQERKTERALDALKNLSSPRALVLRDGQEMRIPGREVVREDLIALQEGDRIPADGTVLSSTNLSIDESLLTGESLPVRKIDWNNQADSVRPGGENLPYVFSGTLVTQGRAIVRVTATGIKTEMGKIGKSLETIHEEDTLIKKETGQIIKKFALAGLILCLTVVILFGLIRGDWIQGLLSGLTLSISMLPEEFAVILVVFLTLGAWRMSKYQVLTRNTATIETLGAATALCVDKTGTITLNQITLDGLLTDGDYFPFPQSDGHIPDKFHSLLDYAILASQQDPFDPLEKAIRKAGKQILTESEHDHHNWRLVQEYPLSQKLMSLSHVWQSPDSKHFVVAAKGAPEAIAGLCRLTGDEKARLESQIDRLANRGLRLIGVAKASFPGEKLPSKQQDFNFEFLGLMAFTDPVRPGVAAAVRECYTAGLRVIMITGDYPGTAQYVAGQIGLKNPDQVITGGELSELSQEAIREKIKTTNIFARVVPEQKLIIIDALKANGEIVAMTGDGVNDAPALKAAHIGIAMGKRGTDVARESSDLVLLDDDFSSIVTAVRTGRRIFDNLKKAVVYIFAVHAPIAGISLLPIIFNWPMVLLPAHIAFLELIIDPACSLVFESEVPESDIMSRPPRPLNSSLFTKKSIITGLVQGLSILIFVSAVYIYAITSGRGDTFSRTITFATLVFSNLLLILTNLSWSRNIFKTLIGRNRALYWVLGMAASGLLIILRSPAVSSLFHFSPLTGVTYFWHLPPDLSASFGSKF